MPGTFLKGLDYFSEQLENLNSLERTTLSCKEYNARYLVSRFSFNSGPESIPGAYSNDVGLIDIPGNSDILFIQLINEAFGGSATLRLGLKDLDGSVISSASIIDNSQDRISNSKGVSGSSRRIYYVVISTTQRSVLYATISGTVWPSNKRIEGYVSYV